jgi:hypothetical protein
VMVVAVGKRERNAVYKKAAGRQAWPTRKSGDGIGNKPFEEDAFVNEKYHKNHSNTSLSHQGYRHLGYGQQ